MNLGKECETIEFKESTSELKEGIRSIASMLNKNQHCVLYFGVKDNGDAIGQQIGSNTLRDISQGISTNIEPAVLPTITLLDGTKDNLKVIKIEVNGKDIPYSAYGQYLVRSADEDKKINRSALRSMFIDSGVDFISDIKSVRQDLTFDQLTSLLVGKGYHVLSLESLEKSKGLRNDDGDFNLMAFLLSDQSDVSVKVVRFLGRDKTSMAQRKEFGNQCLVLALKQSMEYVDALNETNVILGTGARKETNLFDREALEEAWKNACVHNLWMDMVPPAVYIYSDRIEIISTGGLPYGMTQQDFYSGTSKPVNKVLWSIFSSLDYAEQTGHGIPTIVSKYGKSSIDIREHFIQVTIPFAFTPTWVISSQGQNVRNTLSIGQKALLSAIKDNPYARAEEFAKAINMSLSSVKKNLVQLKQTGFIERKGTRRTGHWLIKGGDEK